MARFDTGCLVRPADAADRMAAAPAPRADLKRELKAILYFALACYLSMIFSYVLRLLKREAKLRLLLCRLRAGGKSASTADQVRGRLLEIML
jgi:hypothetical protein